MKAIVLHHQTVLQETEVPLPVPKEKEVLIQIKASGFNPIDYQMLENELERKLIKSPILGRELSGIVVATGKNTTLFNIGDEVYCGCGSMGSNGSYAEYIAVPEAIVALKPLRISFEAAAAIPSVGMTALQIFHRLQDHWHKNILITGASGGVGSFLLQILVAKGYGKSIWATYGNDHGFEKVNQLGLEAGHLINYHHPGWPEQLRGETTIDVVIDLVGNALAEVTATLLSINGIYVDVTALTTAAARETLFNKGIIIFNISNFAYALGGNYDYYQSSLQQLSHWINEGTLGEPAYETIGPLSLATVLAAHQKLKNNQTNAKKLVMVHSS